MQHHVDFGIVREILQRAEIAVVVVEAIRTLFEVLAEEGTYQGDVLNEEIIRVHQHRAGLGMGLPFNAADAENRVGQAPVHGSVDGCVRLGPVVHILVGEEHLFADPLKNKGKRAPAPTYGDQRGRIKEVAVALCARDAAQVDLVELVGPNGQEHFVFFWISVQLEQPFDLVKVLDHFRKFGVFVLVFFIFFIFFIFLLSGLFLDGLLFFLLRPDGPYSP